MCFFCTGLPYSPETQSHGLGFSRGFRVSGLDLEFSGCGLSFEGWYV